VKVGRGSATVGSMTQFISSIGRNFIFLTIEMDPNGGSNFRFIGCMELLSVPFSMHARFALNYEGHLDSRGQ